MNSPENTGLNVPEPVLRPPVRLHYSANRPSKVQVNVQPGDELEVSAVVADQLRAADSHFKDGPAPEAAPEAAEVERPPESGRGSSRKAWAAFAAAQGVDVDDEDTRDDIIAKLDG